ncbi:integrase core domain-containing protein [Porphyromonas macacae]|uniref:integrase core domain-containing protein n=1 Tax=Porphyromonas macacae TaxID=28115 RepID=UPI003744AF1E
MNGKVERSQQIDKTEFWLLIDLSDKTLDLNAIAMEWQEFYNKKRAHSSLNEKTPMQKLKSVEHLIPILPDVTENSKSQTKKSCHVITSILNS